MEKINDLISLRAKALEIAFNCPASGNPLLLAKDIENYLAEGIELPAVVDETNKFLELTKFMCKNNFNTDVDFNKLPKVKLDVKIKKLNENAVIPTYAHDTDAGLDFTTTSYEYKEDIDCHVYGTGLAVEIPEGFVGLCFPRSSNRKTEAYLTNSVGVIDSGYRGEVMASFKNRTKIDYDNGEIPQLVKPYEVGERVFQMIILPYPKVNFIEVEELSDSDRGENGHGSTGK